MAKLEDIILKRELSIFVFLITVYNIRKVIIDNRKIKKKVIHFIFQKK